MCTIVPDCYFTCVSVNFKTLKFRNSQSKFITNFGQKIITVVKLRKKFKSMKLNVIVFKPPLWFQALKIAWRASLSLWVFTSYIIYLKINYSNNQIKHSAKTSLLYKIKTSIPYSRLVTYLINITSKKLWNQWCIAQL